MSIRQTIQKAIEGGYEYRLGNDKIISAEYDDEVFFVEILLDPLFWQCLGKAMGWEGEDMFLTISMPAHMAYWHRFIDHLADGETIDSFFEELK